MAPPNPKSDQRPIIIKKIKKHAGHAHHGGAWKVAYADFVTAMMAFFLLMWLLNATSDEQKMGISNYFDPIGVSQGATGSGGVLGGQSVKAEGVLQDVTASPTIGPPLGSEGDADAEGEGASIGDGAGGTSSARDNLSEEEKSDIEAMLEKYEREQFLEAEQELKEAIENNPELSALADHLIIDQTPEGLRIQIVDHAKKTMFPNGSSRMYSHTKKLLNYITGVVVRMPNKISISGHTDAKQYAQRASYTNWELSTDRANASRRVLLESGISPARIHAVVGKSSTEPLNKKDPYSAINRRISIVLLKKSIVDRQNKEHKATAVEE